MGEIKNPLPVKYFTAITFTDYKFLDEVIKEIEDIFSPVEMKSDIYNFSEFTHYYHKEMGDNLEKIFLVFSELEAPDQLADKKILSNKMEDKYTISGKRVINIDPGYITEAKVVLATTKNYSHRIYLKSGIYGDVHLCFIRKSFQKQPWTYPDYQQTNIINFFNEVRDRYFKQLGEVGYKPAST